MQWKHAEMLSLRLYKGELYDHTIYLRLEEYIQTTPKKPGREFHFNFILSVKR